MIPYHGRRQPYTEIGIRRKRCPRCGRRASRQWSACANGNRQVPVCLRCDVEVNAMVLRFLRIPGAEGLIAAYGAKHAAELAHEDAEAG